MSQPIFKFLKVNVDEHGVCTIMLSRPKARNAWTEPMRDEIVTALDNCSRDKVVRAVIITGDPEARAFCFGAQLPDAVEGSNVGDMFRQDSIGDVPPGREVTNATWRDGGGIASLAVLRCTKPVIAAINGHAVGVGITFPCVCDMRVAAENAKIGFVFARRGLACESLSSWTLPKLVGVGKANELVLTGRVFAAKDAPAGLFNYVVPADQVLSKAYSLAREIADNTSALSVVLCRQSFIRNASLSPEEAHLVESRIIDFMAQGADAAEGIASFREKRPAKFTMDAWRDLPDFHPWWRQIETISKL